MIALLDVNTLVALAWPNHIHHEAAHRWFAEYREQPERGQQAEQGDQGEQSWVTCPITESGFVRVSSNPATTPEARSPVEAIELLQRMVDQPGHVFWSDDISLATDELVSRQRLVGYRQVTDAHLLSLAIRRGGRLVTFDQGILQLVPETETRAPRDLVEVIG